MQYFKVNYVINQLEKIAAAKEIIHTYINAYQAYHDAYHSSPLQEISTLYSSKSHFINQRTCNAPDPHRVRTATIKFFWNKRTKFPLKLDHTQA